MLFSKTDNVYFVAYNLDVQGVEMILYIHDFASSLHSKKATLLRAQFDDVIAFDLSVEPRRAIEKLEAFIVQEHRRTNITLIGSSLGGFYAMYLAEKYDLKAVLINPSIHPELTLAQYADKEVKNYSNNQTFMFKLSYLEQLKTLKTISADNSKFLLLLQTGDETLDYKEALNFLPQAKSVVTSGGTNQFEDFQDYFDIIKNFCYGDSPHQSEDESRFDFSLTINETKKIVNWANEINKILDELDHECLGAGITYTFKPFELGTMIEAEYYGKTLLVRLGVEDSEV